jgi:hypothetical protein
MTDIPGVLNQLGLEGIQNMIRQQESKKKADNGIPSTGNFDEIDLE